MTTRAEEIAGEGPYKVERSALEYDKWQVRDANGMPILTIRAKWDAEAVCKAMNAAYKQGQQDRWIPLSDRYPERGSEFILWDARKNRATPGLFTSDMEKVDWTDKYGFTHWCDYPSPPHPEQR